MMWLVSGAYTGTPESYAVFIHPILSWTFSKFYTLAPNVPWYPLTWFLAVYGSFVASVYVLTFHHSSLYIKSFFAFLLLIISIHFLFFLQFTQVAGYVSMAGFLLLLTEVKTKGQILAGNIFLFLGLIIRFESVVLIAFGVGIWILFKFKKARIIQDFLRFTPIFIMGLCLHFGKIYWEQNSIYSEYLEFNKARSSVIDHPVFNGKIQSNEIAETSKWFYFSRWYFEEGEIEVDGLKEMKVKLDSGFFTLDQLKRTFHRLSRIQGAEAFKSFLAFIIILVFLKTLKTSDLAFLLIWMILFMVLNHFFLFYGRVNSLFLLVCLIPLLTNPIQQKSKIFWIGIKMVMILALIYHSVNFLNEGKGRGIMQDEMLSLTQKSAAKEPIFLEGYQEHMLGLEYNSSNLVPIINQGWLSRSPFQKKILERFEVSSLGELKSYALLAIQMDEALVFPDYMKSLNPDFELTTLETSENFQFLRFESF